MLSRSLFLVVVIRYLADNMYSNEYILSVRYLADNMYSNEYILSAG